VDGPIVSDGTRYGSQEWYDARWNDVPAETKEKLIRHLREQLPPSMLEEVRTLHAKDGDAWVAPFHFHVGMAVRNMLREVMLDDELPAAPYPDGANRNWDDYYVQVLEAAAGVRTD
jgi:hypothetical protein